MSEAEAIEILREVVLESAQIRFPLDLTHNVNREALERVSGALDTLQIAWMSRDCVPKTAVLAMTYLDLPHEMFADFDTELQPELKDIMLTISRKAMRCFRKDFQK